MQHVIKENQAKILIKKVQFQDFQGFVSIENFFQDYEDFDLANEMDELDDFLKCTPPISSAEASLETKSQSKDVQNGNVSSREVQFFILQINFLDLLTY